MISIKNLYKSFGINNKINVLKDVTVDFPEKGLIVLLGQSGSGKTTFLNIMGGLEKASDGDIIIDDKIIKSGSSQTWDAIRNHDIGYIFQNYNLIPTLTVYENIALSLRILGLKDEEEIERRVLYTLKSVKMHHFRARFINQLSGGQQQRIAIARAIVKNPKVILADEPTGNLDTRNTFEIMNIIKKISEEKLVILVTHEKNLVNHYADRIIEIKDGRIVNDYLNEKKSHYAIDDHTIFLKNLKEDQKIQDKVWKIDTYHEDEETSKPNEVTLIVRNETLYLNVGSTIKNVRIVNNESNITIERELTSEEQEKMIEETKFSLIELEGIEKIAHPNSFLSLKKAFKQAIEGMFHLTKKTSLMLSIFFLMGMVMAFGIPFINNVMSNRMLFTSDQQGYISANGVIPSGANYRAIMAMREEGDDSFFINVYKTSPMIFKIDSIDELQRPFLNASLGIHDHLLEMDLVHGRLPENPYEIAVDFSIVLSDYAKNSSTLRKAGMWTYDQVIGREIENMYIPNRPFVITGIVNTGARRIYVAREALVFFNSHNGHNILSSEIFIGDEKFELNGFMPEAYNLERDDYEVLVPESLMSIYPGIETVDFSNGDRFEIDFKVYATGTYSYDDEDFEETMLLPANDVTYRLFQYTITQINISIYSANPAKTIINLEDAFSSIQLSWPYQNAMNEGRVFLLGLRTLMVLGILLIIVSIVSIYFMLKSSLAAQIQEISVYRALGVRKIDIMKKYIAETYVRLTASSVIGFILLTIFIDRIDEALVGGSYYFLVTPIGVIIGIAAIYFIGLLGMIPMFRLLRKSPATLLNYYDI